MPTPPHEQLNEEHITEHGLKHILTVPRQCSLLVSSSPDKCIQHQSLLLLDLNGSTCVFARASETAPAEVVPAQPPVAAAVSQVADSAVAAPPVADEPASAASN